MVKAQQLGLLIFLAGCTAGPVEAPLPDPVLTQGGIETRSDGRCFAVDRGPLTFEVRRDERANTAPERVRLTSAAEVSFEAVCPQTLTQPFVASLQRALAARNAYVGPINGRLDAGTRAAILAYQSARGRFSPVLSVDTARQFGLLSVVRPDD